jgi:hypothetical protein
MGSWVQGSDHRALVTPADGIMTAPRSCLAGIVAKRKADPYAPATAWYKVKNRASTRGDGRWELFERRHR